MIKSMTGYGSAEISTESKRVTVDIRSVNHRYLDLNIKAPRAYGYLDDAIRKVISKHAERGKIDVYVNLENINGDEAKVEVNKEVAKAYYNALCEIKDELDIPDAISLSGIARFSDVFRVEKPKDDNDEIAALVEMATEEACIKFVSMRETEGLKLFDDLQGGLSALEKNVSVVQDNAPEVIKAYRERLEAKMSEYLGSVNVDENRLLNEVAIFADRVDINEEIIRLKSHISQTNNMLKAGSPIGKKLDFVIQEMNRETNTIGSKCNNIEISNTVIEMKSIIEKIREQVQNIE